MHTIILLLVMLLPFLFIKQNYRARYDSEGCRGPMKGRNGGCPTVEVSTSIQKNNYMHQKSNIVCGDVAFIG